MRRRDRFHGLTNDEVGAWVDAEEREDRTRVSHAYQDDRELAVSYEREAAHAALETLRRAGISNEDAVYRAHMSDDAETALRRRADQRWRELFVRLNPGAAD